MRRFSGFVQRIYSTILYRLQKQERTPPRLVVGLLFLVYGVAFYLLRPMLGNSLTAFSMLPVMAAGWYFGALPGLLFGIGTILLNLAVILPGHPDPAGMLMHGGTIAGSITLLLTGTGAGHMGILARRAQAELAERKRVELALRDKEAFNQSVLSALDEQIAILDQAGNIVEVNYAWKAFSQQGGGSPAQTGIGVNYLDVCRRAEGDEAGAAQQALEGILAVMNGDLKSFSQEYPCQTPHELRWFILRVTPYYHNNQVGAVVTHQDITERVNMTSNLQYLSTHDTMTGLYNRAYFEDAFGQIRGAEAYPLSIVMVDVDGLKRMNDDLGHLAGDALLRQAAEVLRDSFRAQDKIMRIGGDEFCIFLEGVDQKRGQLILQRVQTDLERFNRQHGQNRLSLSLGIATAYSQDDLTNTLTQADRNMYQDKAAKSGREPNLN